MFGEISVETAFPWLRGIRQNPDTGGGYSYEPLGRKIRLKTSCENVLNKVVISSIIDKEETNRLIIDWNSFLEPRFG